MSETTTIAAQLRIGEGFAVWVIGATVEETALLDPLPEGAQTVEVRDEDDHETLDAAIFFADNRISLAEDFDEVLPQLGSIPVVWITYPLDSNHSDLDETTLQELLSDYGWAAVESIALDETWAAMRIVQS
jgi:hypothetical protein